MSVAEFDEEGDEVVLGDFGLADGLKARVALRTASGASVLVQTTVLSQSALALLGAGCPEVE